MGIKDETGHIYGNLTVVEYAGTDELGAALWRCRCMCGQDVVRTGKYLRTGKAKRCGNCDGAGHVIPINRSLLVMPESGALADKIKALWVAPVWVGEPHLWDNHRGVYWHLGCHHFSVQSSRSGSWLEEELCPDCVVSEEHDDSIGYIHIRTYFDWLDAELPVKDVRGKLPKKKKKSKPTTKERKRFDPALRIGTVLNPPWWSEIESVYGLDMLLDVDAVASSVVTVIDYTSNHRVVARCECGHEWEGSYQMLYRGKYMCNTCMKNNHARGMWAAIKGAIGLPANEFMEIVARKWHGMNARQMRDYGIEPAPYDSTVIDKLFTRKEKDS